MSEQHTEEVEQFQHEAVNKIASEIVDLADSLEDSGVNPYTVVTGLALAHDIKATEEELPLVVAPISREFLEDDGCDNA